MNDKKILNLIETHKESKNIFKNSDARISSPIQAQMLKFMHLNIDARKNVLPGFSRFKPEDLK